MKNKQLIRSDTDYGIRIMIYLALHGKDGAIPMAVLAEAQKVPIDFAYKVLQKLGKSGLVKSIVGPRGGFSLAREPNKINLLDIINSIQGLPTIRPCVLDEKACPMRLACPVSAKLAKLQDSIQSSLSSIELADIAKVKKSSRKTSAK